MNVRSGSAARAKAPKRGREGGGKREGGGREGGGREGGGREGGGREGGGKRGTERGHDVTVVAVGRRRGRPLVDDKRRRILDAALRTFAERGYHGTSVPEVAEAAGIGIGTLYRYFDNKDALVNEVYRDAKLRLREALLGAAAASSEGKTTADAPAAGRAYTLDQGRAWFGTLWHRLAAFARAEPETFRFLEMQDHAPYLDPASKALELSVLAPLWMAGKQMRAMWGGPPVDILIALMWGAFVGLVKAERLGYLVLDDRAFEQAGEAAWQMIARAAPRTDGPRR